MHENQENWSSFQVNRDSNSVSLLLITNHADCIALLSGLVGVSSDWVLDFYYVRFDLGHTILGSAEFYAMKVQSIEMVCDIVVHNA